MGTDENKKLVVSFLEKWSSNDFVGALALMADTGSWWVGGKPDKFALAGIRSKSEFVELLNSVLSFCPGGLKLIPKSLVAEKDRVVVEAESYAETTNGKTYQNQYHFLFEVRGGKIHAVREYLDTMHAKEVLVDR
ncbi:MAG: nuclear transport factor 2 family protein [Syntrophales bacterium]